MTGAVVAGIIGAIIALGGGAILQSAGYLPSFAEVPATEPATSGDYASQSEVASLNQQIAALKDEVSTGSANASDGSAGADVSALGQRVDALEKSAGSAGADGAAALKPVLDAANAAQSAAAGAQQSADAAGQSASKANDAAAGAQKTAGDAGSAADAAKVSADAAAEAAQAAQDGVEATQASIGQVVDRLTVVEKNGQEARVALAAANLKSGIDSGGPFMSQLETYAKVSGPSETINELRGYAADGVPLGQALAAQWPSVRDKVSASLTPAQPSAPVQDQFFSGLKSLVQVRPSGPAAASDTGPQAVVSRLTAAIEGGDLQTFQTEWQTLPDPAKAASQDFADKVEARVTAQKAVSGALSSALSPNGTGSANSSANAPSGAAPAAQGGASKAPASGTESSPQAAPAPAAAAGTQG